jgi:hypothetical protein
MEGKHIIEVNGVKMEVDLRQATVISNFRVGDKVKLLLPEYSSGHKVLPGIIVGFEAFSKLPTIVVAYLEVSYNSAEMKFHYFNAESKAEVIPASDDYHRIEKSDVVRMFDKMIEAKRNEVVDMEAKKAYFLSRFQTYFKDAEQVATA